MDTQIFFSALLSFFLFLAVIAVLFRMTRREAAIDWMIRIFVAIGVVTSGVYARSWDITEYIWWASLYGLLTALFVFGIFSIMEASVTLRIFTEIARTGGVVSNTSRIIQRRIARLLYSGELKRTHGHYVLGRISYFRFREFFLNIFRSFFD